MTKAFDEHFMRMALREAEKAAADGEVPTGCVIVDTTGLEEDAPPAAARILARAHNMPEQLQDATAHAEMLALTAAAEARGAWRLTGTRLYVTKEPCPMCAGAIINARIPTLVYGARDESMGSCASVLNLFEERYGHRPAIYAGVLAQESAVLLRRFFQDMR